jgi:serine/threonine protein phosphatase PrpC
MSRAGREPGFKKQNQDNCFAFEKYITANQSLFGAFDGHGPNGHLVSGYVKQHLPIMLVNHLGSEGDVSKALTKGFMEVDKALGSSRIDCEFSGSTAVVSFLSGKTLTTAWVGDSRGVLARINRNGGGYEAVSLTKDHKPTLAEEKARIIASSGRVERLVDEVGQPIGPFRVWLQYAWIPGLAMSRALGDVLAHQVGVTSEPECTITELTPDDKFMVLASDGVWEFIDGQGAVNIIGACDTVEEGCRQLVDEAYQKWLVEEDGVVDDITAVVVRFNHSQ